MFFRAYLGPRSSRYPSLLFSNGNSIFFRHKTPVLAVPETITPSIREANRSPQPSENTPMPLDSYSVVHWLITPRKPDISSVWAQSPQALLINLLLRLVFQLQTRKFKLFILHRPLIGDARYNRTSWGCPCRPRSRQNTGDCRITPRVTTTTVDITTRPVLSRLVRRPRGSTVICSLAKSGLKSSRIRKQGCVPPSEIIGYYG